ncbi:hypothetical protein GCM10010372_77230 [Streptomyces tauricus]|nr:hypothetical protein GCM10010372_77230 [Streptomyces tauricus]
MDEVALRRLDALDAAGELEDSVGLGWSDKCDAVVATTASPMATGAESRVVVRIGGATGGIGAGRMRPIRD